MRIGLVGCGLISQHHLRAATSFAGNEVVGIADRDLERAHTRAQHFKIPRVFANLGQLLELRPDVIHVLTPPESHEALVIQALTGGAHVYVEKPMAISAAACENMARASAHANRQLCVGHSLLYTPAMAAAREALASGIAGQVVHAAASFNYDVRRNPNYREGHWAATLPGGLAEDLAVHPASILISLLGPPQRVMAVSRPHPEVPDGKTADVSASILFEHGVGSLAISLRARPDMGLVDIACTRRMLRLNISSMSMSAYRELSVPKAAARGLANIDIAAQLVSGTLGAAWKLLRGQIDGSYGLTPLIHSFYAALQAGRPVPVSASDGTMAVSVMRAIWPDADTASRMQAVN